MRNQNFEVLAPAGSFAMLKAVIAAGADAVYLAGNQFGARAYAGNFSPEELEEAISYAHLRDVKVYMTVNTLLKNEEIDQLVDYLRPFYLKGLDAVLVQDFGALNLLHSAFPDLDLHSSTQMTIVGKEGISFLKKYGVKRVVMAREVSVAEMQEMRETTGMEIEAFVHGALCYSYSGQCLFSSLLGGRSGNRGRCAGPCRLNYDVLEGKTLKLKDSYVLSLKDFVAIKHLEQLQKAGVYSLKIEGRMKQPGYAAGVTALYRKYADLLGQHPDAEISSEDYKRLLRYGTRCGSTDLYLNQQNDKSMVTYQKPSFLQEAEYLPEEARLDAQGEVIFKRNQAFSFSLTCQEKTVTITGQEPMEAQNRPVTLEDLRDRLSKTGETDFRLSDLHVEWEDGLFLPNGQINQLRREAFAALREALLQEKNQSYQARQEKEEKQDLSLPAGEKLMEEKASATINVISLSTREQVDAFLSMDGEILSHFNELYVDTALYGNKAWEDYKKDLKKAREAGLLFRLAMPKIFRQKTSDLFGELLPFLKENRPDGFLVSNYETLEFCLEAFGPEQIVIDHNLYSFNDYAVSSFGKLGICRETLPLELNRGEIIHRLSYHSEMILYGYYPMMVTANCINRNANTCDKRNHIYYLKDRYKAKFPVTNTCTYCYNMVYNSLPTMLFPYRKELKKQVSAFRLNFTVESQKEMKNILMLYLDYLHRDKVKLPADLEGHFTNGHYKRGVE